MSRGTFAGGKRQREADKARKKKEKRERLRRNREGRGGGTPIATVEEVQTAAMQAPATPPPEPGSFAPAPRRQSTAGRELFIGRLSWDTVEDDLRDLFASVGPVEKAVIITDRDTGRSRGFGFVTMGDEKAAARAIEELDGAELDGRAIRVRIAESR